MTSERSLTMSGVLRLAVAGAMGAMLGGCLQTAPVVVTPEEQASRIVYNCPGGKTLDVTRLRDQRSVILVVDGNTLQLGRDASYTSAERYTNRLQTLTLFNNVASYDSVGRGSYGPCTDAGGGDERSFRTRGRSRDSDD